LLLFIEYANIEYIKNTKQYWKLRHGSTTW